MIRYSSVDSKVGGVGLLAIGYSKGAKILVKANLNTKSYNELINPFIEEFRGHQKRNTRKGLKGVSMFYFG